MAYVLPEPKRHVIAYAGWSCVLPEPKGHVIAYAGMSYDLTEPKGHVIAGRAYGCLYEKYSQVHTYFVASIAFMEGNFTKASKV